MSGSDHGAIARLTTASEFDPSVYTCVGVNPADLRFALSRTASLEGAARRLERIVRSPGVGGPGFTIEGRELVAAINDLLALLPNVKPDSEARAFPEPPFPPGVSHNARREGWRRYFWGSDRDACPFPRDRHDLQLGYLDGWDAAKAFSDSEEG